MKVARIVFRYDTLLLMSGVALIPVYIFASGGVQPTHILLALFAGISLISRGIPNQPITISLFLLFVLSISVEGFYIVIGGNPAMLIHSIFILYNFVIVAAIYGYCRRYGIEPLVPAVCVAATIAVVTVASSGVNLRELVDGRSTGSFNNPNQLGYFSVCVLSLAYLFYREGLIRYILLIALIGACLFLAISSLSKAAMVAVFMVAFFALKPKGSRRAFGVWLIGLFGTAFALFYFYEQGAFNEYLFAQRLQNMLNENDSSLASRGYFAILQGNALQMVFGLGNELVDKIVGHEVHSTPGSFLNNYGILGFLIFTSLIFYWVFVIWRSYDLVAVICLTGPAMLYGITHNGSRFTIFWLLVAVSTAMAQRKPNKRAKHSSTNLINRAKYREVPSAIP